ncbi:MAG: siroheme synthase CysG [Pseudomonadales bacterium]|nr:siroheme synthase CysG [Pseudomonadales bacterium]
MDFLPVFMRMKNETSLVVGGDEAAARKVELLLRAQSQVTVISTNVIEGLQALIDSGAVAHHACFTESMLDGVQLVVSTTDDEALRAQVVESTKKRGIPLNVAGCPELCSFVFPAVIDRSPVIAAVSSGGELPVLTRLLRSRLEAAIPAQFGRLTELAAQFRDQVRAVFPNINQRRRFWEKHLEGHFAELVYAGQELDAQKALKDSLAADQFSATGEVYLVGAGPGDPDLLSFRALRLIRQADVVLYDRLVSKPILEMVKHDAERIHVGKERANHAVPQQDINELLVTLAKQGKRVLRLKGGDPFIFGRGGEEIERLAEESVPFQVVPGITAASGCSSYAGIPLTHRNYSQSVRFITGHLKNNTCDLPWQEFVAPHQTLVFYMGLTGLPVISSKLIEHGLDKTTPIALVSKGTTPEQQVIVGTLETIVDQVEKSNIAAPTLIIVGEVVLLREKLRWFD